MSSSKPILALLVLLSPAWPRPAAAEVTASARTLPGLERRVEIVRDRFGVAHIYAETEHDLFYAQGCNAARDRLFQLELWRRQATGTLAEVLGPGAVERDRSSRLLRFRGDVEAELLRYHPHGPAIVHAFVDGINACVEEASRHPEGLPVEFRLLGFTPGRWTPEVVVSRHSLLSQNVTSEVDTARLVRALGPEGARALLDLRPGRPSLDPDPALDLAALGPEILKGYEAFLSPVVVAAPGATPSPSPRVSVDDGGDALAGSNNWVIAPGRTFRGSALLANDPHRRVQVPSLRYIVHLVAPGWNVIGGGEPSLPGVAIGHNESGAWGLTVFRTDQEDLYAYDTDPANPSRYRYGSGFEAMRIEKETIRVKGGAPIEVALKFTRHGPVLHEDTTRHKAYALRAAWLEPGAAPYLASLRLDQARSGEDFRAAASYFFAPGENLVWADTTGAIAFQAVGLTPERPNWNGLLPVPGDGRFEWSGFRPIADLPHRVDPAEGWIATANHDTQPPGYARPVGYQWTAPNRYARIAEVLSQPRLFTMADMTRLQQDETCLPARALVPLLRGLAPKSEEARKARAALLAWDQVLDRDSVGAAVYAIWEKALLARARERLVPASAREIFRGLRVEKVTDWLTSPDGRFGEDPLGGRDRFVLDALDDAVRTLRDAAGPDASGWTYGQPALKHVRLTHPLSAIADAATRARLDLGPLPRGGNARTVNATSDDLNQTDGASFRIVADTGDWDLTLATNTPGQSGDPASPHYRDLFAPWARGEYFPLLFSREKVESVAEERTVLQAGSASAASPARPAKPGASILIASESFDYPVGQKLSGLAGGSGWAGPWFTSPLNQDDSRIGRPGMTRPGLTATGGKVVTAGKEIRTFRTLALGRKDLAPWVDDGRLGRDGSTVWIAFVTALSDLPGNSNEGYGSIHLNDGVGDLTMDQYGDKRNHQRIQIGDRNSATNYYFGRVTNGAPGSAGYDTTVPFDTTPHLVVTRIDFHPGDETFWLFIDPVPGQEPKDADAIATGPLSDFRFDTVQVGSGGSRFPDEKVDTDELRIGTSYASVLPRAGARK
jgi:penicillin amidase